MSENVNTAMMLLEVMRWEDKIGGNIDGNKKIGRCLSLKGIINCALLNFFVLCRFTL
jgi:hypothetical protein